MELIIIILSAIIFGVVMALLLFIKIGIDKQRMIDIQIEYIHSLEDSYKTLRELDDTRREYCELIEKKLKTLQSQHE